MNASLPVVFLAFANDSARPLPRLGDECRGLKRILGRSRHCELVVSEYATAADLIEKLTDPKYTNRIAVFHFAGHAGSYELLLESPSGKAVAAYASGLASLLKNCTELQLVFLNGCATQAQARGLLDAGVSIVIATLQSVDDSLAVQFAEDFYQLLADGDAISVAFDKAKAAMQFRQGIGPAATRELGAVVAAPIEEWPWKLHVRAGSAITRKWNLPDAAGDPLFGLPEISDNHYRQLPDAPFCGLTWFHADSAALFFGRGHQIRDLYKWITARNSPPLLLFYGQSGVGKSSLLDAGLRPRLERDFTIRYVRRDPERRLLGAAMSVLDGADGDFASAWAAIEARDGRPLVLIVDQAEEVFTRPSATPERELPEFLEAMKAVSASPERWPRGHLILGFRKEWLAEIAGQVERNRLPCDRFFLERLDRRGIMEAISQPARLPELSRYRLSIADELPSQIADELLVDTGSAVAPTLQIVLTKMWAVACSRNPEQPRFDAALYRDLLRDTAQSGGGEPGLRLSDVLDQQLVELKKRLSEVTESGLALDLLAFHTTKLGTADEHSRRNLKLIYRHRAEAIIDELVRHCQDLYLLCDVASECGGMDQLSRLAHDTLGPLVRRRFDESYAPGQRAGRALENRAVDWRGGKVGAALDETDLEIVEAGAAGMRARNADEERLVAASVAARDRAVKERRQRADSEKQRLRMLVVGAATMAAVFGGLGMFAWRAKESEEKAKIAAMQLGDRIQQQLKEKAEQVAILEQLAKEDPKAGEFLLARGIHLAVPASSTDVGVRDAGAGVAKRSWFTVAELTEHYRFPSKYTGAGQVIALVHLGGGYLRRDIDRFFKDAHLATPTISDVLVDGAKNATTAKNLIAQVESSIEVVGAAAPGAQIKVVFTPNTSNGYANGIKRAISIGANIIVLTWGGPESSWTKEALQDFNQVLQRAASQEITVLAASGDQGASDGMPGGVEVDFPSSSPWVLAVGGTSIKAGGFESIWRDSTLGSGGGFSTSFARPTWQSAIGFPNETGRGTPDVAAAADPAYGGVVLQIDGALVQLGGTELSTLLWGGLIARLAEALQKPVGYINLRLYEAGAEGLLKPVEDGGGHGKWSPIVGWGVPDGEKLFEWLKTHPAARTQ